MTEEASALDAQPEKPVGTQLARPHRGIKRDCSGVSPFGGLQEGIDRVSYPQLLTHAHNSPAVLLTRVTSSVPTHRGSLTVRSLNDRVAVRLATPVAGSAVA